MKSIFISALLYLGALFGVYIPAAGTAIPANTNMQNSASTASSTAFIPDDERLPPVVTSSIGSTVLHSGQFYTLTWLDKNPNVIVYTFDLEFVTNKGFYVGQILGTATSTSQSFTFKVPTDTFPKTNYQIYFVNSANKHILVGTQAFTIQ
jgi:hypothetical protein